MLRYVARLSSHGHARVPSCHSAQISQALVQRSGARHVAPISPGCVSYAVATGRFRDCSSSGAARQSSYAIHL